MLQSTTANRQADALAMARSRPKAGFKQKRFVIGGAIIVLAIGFLIFNTMRDTMMYYLTVSELLSRGEAAYGEQVRLGGNVVEGTVQSDGKMMTLRFVVSDNAKEVPVLYKGVVPDSFKPGAEVVLEGKLSRSGLFEASTLLAKCPSKYEPES